ncbi:hypothetical protein [Thaumasiovibrio sp. DFM-14]|uniref:DUF7507 domain-containing protein n=1 Tax=Thaumasiovibrio sp. DFM-14 TaxID=3384792 RepID=UPI0039A16CD1
MTTLNKGKQRLSAVVLLSTLLSGVLYAAHDVGLFELDANTVQDATSAPAIDDASMIYCDENGADPDCVNPLEGPSPVNPSNAIVSVFATDPVNGGATGDSDDIADGAKDTINFICTASDPSACNDWGWKLGSSNDKNDIQNVFAALYQAADGDYYLYFGVDGYSNAGDAAYGFWFLQSELTKNSDGSLSSSHNKNDILVQVDLDSAAGNSTDRTIGRAALYTWEPVDPTICPTCANDPVQPSQGHLHRQFEVSSADCDTANANDLGCGIINSDTEWAPWTHEFKGDGAPNDPAQLPKGVYFEGGINLSAFFSELPCVQSMLVETRQSNSETAEIEDLALLDFDLCGIKVVKTADSLSKVGDAIDYTVEVHNVGALPLTKVSIKDTLAGDLSSDGDCGATLDPNTHCTINYTYTPASSSGSVKNYVTAIYSRGQDTFSETDSKTTDLFKPQISFDKTVNGGDGPVTALKGAKVDYSLEVMNKSEALTPTLQCVLTDTMLIIDPHNSDGDNNPHTIGFMLANGATETIDASRTFSELGTFVNTASVSCSPKGFSNKVYKRDQATVNIVPAKVSVVKKGDRFSKVGDSVDYTFKVTNLSAIALKLTQLLDNKLGNLLDPSNTYVTSSSCSVNLELAPNQSCDIAATRTTQAGDSDPYINVVNAQFVDELGTTARAKSRHIVDLLAPSYTVTKTCLTDPVPAGAAANFRIDIVNTGDVGLLVDVDDPLLSISYLDQLLGKRGAATCNDNDWGDGSNGCWRIEQGIIATGSEVVNTVHTLATLPVRFGLPNQLSQTKEARCEVEQEGATRTLGFWRTHGGKDGYGEPSGYTCHVFEDHLGGSLNLGWVNLTDCEDVFGLFWSNPGKEADSSKRPKACREKLQASWQLLAALLNSGLDNGSSVPVDSVTNKPITTALIDELGGNMDRSEIIRLKGLLGAYNESGDNVTIIDNDGTFIAPADPNGAKHLADFSVVDNACN